MHKQVTSKNQQAQQLLAEQKELDQKYLSGWGSLRDVTGAHFATSGNVGKMAGPSRHAFLQKEHDEAAMKEVWQRASEVMKLKQNL